MKAFAERVPSPCVGVCQMKETDGLCIGCFRAIGEIAGWSNRSDDERRAILSRARARAAERSPAPTAGHDDR